MKQQQEILSRYLKNIQLSGKLSRLVYQKGKQLYEMGQCHLMASSTGEHEYLVKDDYQDFKTKIIFSKNNVEITCSCLSPTICSHAYAVASQTFQDLSRSIQVNKKGAMKYSREGMMKRVLEERENRAKQEKYQLDFSDNIYGEHHLYNEQGKRYKISFYNFEKKLGYCSCPDYQTNKLETCKHLIYAFHQFELKYKDISLPKQSYPFLEIFRHPLFDYQISWFYPHKPQLEIQEILNEYFDKNQLYKPNKNSELHIFIEKIQQFKTVKIRPEVNTLIEEYYEEKSLNDLFSGKSFKADLLLKSIYPFQQKGIEFLSAREGCILADEIGTGKSVQALGTALYKIQVLGFETIKILSPKHLITHWEQEIQKWIPSLFISVFKIESFEEINIEQEVDFLIIDEAQKITDYDSNLLHQLHQIQFKHILLITDSKLENSLIKFYAMAGLINQYLLTPLWELSYKHCLFDPANPEKIVGYYNLDKLPNKLQNVYLRREKSEINDQLPEANRVIIPVALDERLKEEQSNLSVKILALSIKKKATSYDQMQIKSHLKKLYSLGQYTASLSPQEKDSPKLEEFRHFIRHKLNLVEGEKVVIFINELKVQQQVQMLLQDERKRVQIIANNQNSFHDEIQYFITAENLQNTLPKAHHFIYFHIPNLLNAIAERSNILEETPSGIQQNRVYLLLATQSLESIFYQWSEKKPYFLNQLTEYISKDAKIAPLSLRLNEELSHELKMLILPSINKPHPSLHTQMDLFGKTLTSENIKSKKTKEYHQHELSSFFESMLESFSVFTNLNADFKKILLEGKFKISEEKGEIIIRIKKKDPDN